MRLLLTVFYWTLMAGTMIIIVAYIGVTQARKQGLM